ncbi:hypothetical protein ACOSQ3_017538 [Xanthoceras sorbifolium]
MTDFRPISLFNVLYKIIAKTLANWFCLVLGQVISNNQSSFIPSRLISDNTIIGFECLNVLNQRHRRKKGYMAIKFDMSKAYDRVKWPFLEGIMRKLGSQANALCFVGVLFLSSQWRG